MILQHTSSGYERGVRGDRSTIHSLNASACICDISFARFPTGLCYYPFIFASMFVWIFDEEPPSSQPQSVWLHPLGRHCLVLWAIRAMALRWASSTTRGVRTEVCLLLHWTVFWDVTILNILFSRIFVIVILVCVSYCLVHIRAPLPLCFWFIQPGTFVSLYVHIICCLFTFLSL